MLQQVAKALMAANEKGQLASLSDPFSQRGLSTTSPRDSALICHTRAVSESSESSAD